MYDVTGHAHTPAVTDGSHPAGVQNRSTTELTFTQGPLLHGPLQGHPERNMVALKGPRAVIWRKGAGGSVTLRKQIEDPSLAFPGTPMSSQIPELKGEARVPTCFKRHQVPAGVSRSWPCFHLSLGSVLNPAARGKPRSDQVLPLLKSLLQPPPHPEKMPKMGGEKHAKQLYP